MQTLSKDWEESVMSMAKHKMLEKMEELNKKDTEDLTHDCVSSYKDAARAIYYILCVEKELQK